ncbi:MAG: OmpA family protein [Salibacteraceae bacterium]
MLIPLFGIAQDEFVITRPKDLKVEYTPKPRDFKTKSISWGEMDSKCRKSVITHGNWFKIYPVISKLRITVSTGFNWGDISDPYVYVGYLDTVKGYESLVEVACDQFQGAQGDFALEVFDLVPDTKYYLLIGGDAKKLRYGLHLTQRFGDDTVPEPNNNAENTVNASSKSGEEQAKDQNQNGDALIIGRVRDINGEIVEDFDLMLLNDDLEQTQEVKTDEYGGFRFTGINPNIINLIKAGGDDSELIIDLFLYDEDGQIIGKPISLGHRLMSFKARKDYFNELAILSEKDVFVDVERGGSSMAGKVVDKETYLIGREGVEVGLYSDKKNLLETTTTDLNGLFTFDELENKDYIVKVEHNPEDDYVEIVLADEYNVPYAVSNSNDSDAEGYFKFRTLPKEIVELRRMEMVDRSDNPLKSTRPKEIIKAGDEGQPIELSTIEFKTASSTLTEATNLELDQLAKELKQKSTLKIKIDGHTDNVGSNENNLKLSNERAEAVKGYLVQKGVSADRIQCQGFGSTRPLVSNDSESGRAKNRRVEFTVVKQP